MPRDLFDDESLSDPRQLLTQYRQLCKALGVAQATGAPVTGETLQQISRVEAELQTRLWLAGRGDGATGRRGEGQRESQNPEPRTQNPTSSTQHLAPGAQHAVLSPQPSALAAGTAEVYSDGSCLGNPGPGGFGTIVRVAGHPERVLSAGKARTTNNEMELTGALEGLKVAVSLGAAQITVATDSEYLVKGMNSWMKGWLRNGWKTRTGDPVKNKELWEDLHRLTDGREVTWTWVPGHAGHIENERCNSLAIAAAQKAAGPRGK